MEGDQRRAEKEEDVIATRKKAASQLITAQRVGSRRKGIEYLCKLERGDTECEREMGDLKCWRE